LRNLLLIIAISCCFRLSAQFTKADSIITFAQSLKGTNYCYASASPGKGFDCSGFTYYVFEHFKIKTPRSSIDYSGFGKKVSIDSCKKGDIIVFTGTNAANRKPGHVGIVIEGTGDNVRFIHSSSSKKHYGVVESTFSESPYYKKRFIKVVRILP
jgi:murein DD-endopeptidase / murein LD-carboxypeptidase